MSIPEWQSVLAADLPGLDAAGAESMASQEPIERLAWRSQRQTAMLSMLARLQEKKPMNSYAIECEDYSLFRAIRRYLKNWHEAMRAAGLDPALYRLCPGAPVR